jgi:hypothetical protein
MYRGQQVPTEETGRRRRLSGRLRGNPVTSIVLALCLIWGAAILFWDMNPIEGLEGVNRGAIFLIGLGIIIAGGGFFRLLQQKRGRGTVFSFILSLILIAAGVGQMMQLNNNMIVIIVLLVVAVAVLVNAFSGRDAGQ